EEEIVNIHNKTNREKYFSSIMKAVREEVYSFSYGMETGEYYGARRNAVNEIEIMENNAATKGKTRYYAMESDLTAGRLVQETDKFDPRSREWYRIAQETHQPFFSPIYKHFVMEDLAVSAAYPIFDKQGLLMGVLGTHITLNKINNYLKDLVQDKLVTAYIVEKNSGYLVANSLEMPNFHPLADGKIKRIALEEIDNKAIIAAYQEFKENAKANVIINTPDDRMYVRLTEYTQPGLDWLIITAIPESYFMANILKSMSFLPVMSVITIIIAIIIYIKITEIILKPIYHLIGTTEKFSEGDFLQRARVFRNDEIGRLSNAFNKMAEQIYVFIHTLEERIKDRTMELEQTISELRNSEDNIRLLLDSTAEAIYGIDQEGNCTFCNASSLKLLGYKQPEDLIGKNMHLTIHHKRLDGTPIPREECKVVQMLVNGEYVHEEEEVFWRSDGTSFPVEYFSYPQYRNGGIIGAVVTFLDITERKKSEAKILYLSYRDQLTGLYNRRFFQEELGRLDVPRMLPLTIIMADVNGLKLINDSLGHTAGDELLRKVGEVLVQSCRASDIIARLGGDEFIVLLPHTASREAELVIRRIKTMAAREKAGAVDVSIALGHGTKSQAAENIDDISKIAEDRMYRNKLLESPRMRRKALNTIILALHEQQKEEEVHSRKVAELCRDMGEALGLTGEEIEELKTAGLLHDIGKIAIEQKILGKPGKLSKLEWDEIKRHPEIGYRLLNTVNEVAELAGYVLAHHERWDGLGYPKGLKGNKIPLQARIVSIAEAYAAMISERSYADTLSKEQAVAELEKNSGTQFDAELVRVFVDSVLVK
ncbi:MAG TPA: HD domain-containing phosphohydrolase, partial [Patescibacteria group bacterium]|nr:HD domain-containing phosphohydrolase [Patescibacteria group bacterium]